MQDPALNNLPADTEALDRLYAQLISEHDEYLTRLKTAFDGHCDAIRAEAKKKMAQLPEADEAGHKTILEEEASTLNKTLAELKGAIRESELKLRTTLEAIEEKIEAAELNIEATLASIK